MNVGEDEFYVAGMSWCIQLQSVCWCEILKVSEVIN